MRSLILCVLVFVVICSAMSTDSKNVSPIERLVTLKKLFDMELIDQKEYLARKKLLMDEISGVSDAQNTSYSPQLNFLLNRFIDGLPRSYADVLPTGDVFWLTPMYLEVGSVDEFGNPVPLDSRVAIQERTLTRFGLNLYDGATWEIALALEGLYNVAYMYESNILYPSSTGSNTNVGGLIDIRSDTTDFVYGIDEVIGSNLPEITLPGNVSRVVAVNGNPTGQTSKQMPGAFFYRMIGPKYFMTDPMTGDYANSFKYPWPNQDPSTSWNIAGLVHWNDWKPITGENVWAAIIGPIQSLWISNGSIAPFTTFATAPPQIQLALSILPALNNLQSPLGSLYHCPKGTNMYPPDPNEQTNISNENNFSGYAALNMLYEILVNKTSGTTDPILVQALTSVTNLRTGLLNFFSKQLLSDPIKGFRVVYQGGHVTFSGQYIPAQVNESGGFAVDCQTWGASVLGQANLDSWYGPETAYNLWQATKKLAGFYTDAGQLAGVGYTVEGNGSEIWSAEWTWGAIGACEKLAYEYGVAGRKDLQQSLLADAASMYSAITQPMIRCPNGAWCGGGLVQEDGSYLYANTRFFIPWGWYANPIGATCSTAWAIMHEYQFNPFILGGGYTSPLSLK